jgi:hypothetical protein
MPNIPRVTVIESDGDDIFVTKHAGTWISLEPGWSVQSHEDHSKIAVEYQGVRVH